MEYEVKYIATKTKSRGYCERLLRQSFNVKKDAIGGGAYGKVYQVCNKDTEDCDYALKVIIYDKVKYEMSGRQELKSESSIERNWRREVKILKKLNICQKKYSKKFVPKLHDHWRCQEEDNTYFYILMEKFEGNLSDFIEKYRSVPPVKVATRIALNLLDSNLDLIHSTCNVCLNDIKLENILYKQVGEYNYIFVFADTGNSTEEVNEKCKKRDQNKFRQYIDEFERKL